MTTKNESKEKSFEPNAIQTFFTDLDKKGTELAKQLHEAKFIYAVYGLLDGLSLSYSMVKYCFDLMYTNSSLSSSDKLHDWMTTPEGMAAAAAESMTIIGFSIVANYFDKKDKNAKAFQRYMAVVWPYCRDALKGMKNAYKGVRSTLQVSSMLSGQSLNHLIVPTGVALGAIAVLNRMWMRNMRNKRKELQSENGKLLKEIQEKAFLDEKEAQDYIDKIGRQSSSLQERALLSSAYAGVVDGLYLYMGAMGFAALSPPVFTAMSVFCVMFTFACIATRIYEEYDYQRKLRATEVNVELAVCGKQLDELFFRLQELSERRSQPNLSSTAIAEIEAEQAQIIDAFDQKLEAFVVKRCELVSLNSLSNASAILAGMQNGLAAYSAIMSSVYAVATVNAMFLAPLPPVFLVGAILAGTASLIAFALHSFHKNASMANTIKDDPPANLGQLLNAVKEDREIVKNLDSDMYNTAMEEGLRLGETPQHFTQEWLEVVRSLFSGVAKGQKTVDYTFNSLQEPDEQGHYHDTPVMHVLTLINSCVFALGLSLRALARGLKDKNDASSDNAVDHPDERPIQALAKSLESSDSRHQDIQSVGTVHEETEEGLSMFSTGGDLSQHDMQPPTEQTPKHSPRFQFGRGASPIHDTGEATLPTDHSSPPFSPSFFRSRSAGNLQRQSNQCGFLHDQANSLDITPGLA